MSENININHANLADIDSVMEISEESNLSYWSYEDYCAEIAEIKHENSVFLTAKDKHSLKIIGFIVSRLIIADINILEIYNIAVRSNHKRRGVGQNLVNEVFRICRRKDVSEIWLDVRKFNIPAIKFYEKNDFEVEYERKNLYNNPIEDSYIMCHRIQTNSAKIKHNT
jgi:[ribosomal protein S18]-alanine N-acetyltransferase